MNLKDQEGSPEGMTKRKFIVTIYIQFNLYHYCYFYSKSKSESVKTLVINLFTVPLLACIYILPEIFGIWLYNFKKLYQ